MITHFTQYNAEPVFLASCFVIVFYSCALTLCRANKLVLTAYSVMVLITIIDFGVSAIYALNQTMIWYNIANIVYYLYMIACYAAMLLILIGLVAGKNDGGTIRTNNELYSCDNTDNVLYRDQNLRLRNSERYY